MYRIATEQVQKVPASWLAVIQWVELAGRTYV